MESDVKYVTIRQQLTPVASEVNELATALAKAQGAIEGAKKRSVNPGFRSRYADLASVWDACREELSSNGLSIIQMVCDAAPGFVGLETVLMHSSGQSITNRFSMPVKDPNNAQAVGSAITYARRYALMAIVGIAPEDDDGTVASGTKVKQPVSDNVNWKEMASEALSQFSAASVADKRKLYAYLRDSAMPADLKAETLKAFEASMKEQKDG